MVGHHPSHFQHINYLCACGIDRLEYNLQNSGKFVMGIITVIPENGGNREMDIMAVNGRYSQKQDILILNSVTGNITIISCHLRLAWKS